MNTRRIKNLLLLTALVLAVAVTVPLAGAFALLFRAAGIAVIAAGLVAAAVALAISSDFRHWVSSLTLFGPEADRRQRIGGVS